MHTSKRVLAFALILALTAALFSGCTVPDTEKAKKTGLVNVKTEMYDADYWTSAYKQKDKVLLTAEDILHFNTRTIQNSAGMEDITYYSNNLGGVQLGVYMKEYAMPEGNLYSVTGEPLYEEPEKQYDEDGNEIENKSEEPSYKDLILENRGADDLAPSNPVFYGLVLANTALRRFPTGDSAFASPTDHSEDLFRVRTLLIGDPVVVLHKSVDEMWYFVQTRNCRGWVLWSDVVMMEKSQWLNFIRAENFIVVTDSSVTVPAAEAGKDPVTLYMGTMLPLADPEEGSTVLSDGAYTVLLPATDPFENYTTVKMEIPRCEGVHVGYLEYTPENVTQTAFRLSGQKLSAGGIGGGWDENSFFSSVLACFGIYMPFTVEEQSRVASDDEIDLTLAATKDIITALDAAAPGTLLYTDFGAGFYLGHEDGHYYVLQPADSFFIDETRYTANRILVTDMDIVYDNGAAFLSAIRLIKPLSIRWGEL